MSANPTYATVPCNFDAERDLLGILLYDPAALTAIEGLVRPIDFYSRVHGLIFAAVHGLSQAGTGVTLPGVCERLRG